GERRPRGRALARGPCRTSQGGFRTSSGPARKVKQLSAHLAPDPERRPRPLRLTFVNPRQRGRRLLTENGEGSTEAISPGSVLTAWADEETVVVAGEHQTVLVRQGQQVFAPVPGVRAGYASSAWAFGADDVWLGSLQGLAHYDGQAWSVVHELEVQDTVRFGSDGSDLFFASERECGRVR